MRIGCCTVVPHNRALLALATILAVTASLSPSKAAACCPECELPYGIHTHVTPFQDGTQMMWGQRFQGAVAPLVVMVEYCCPARWYHACFNNNYVSPAFSQCGGTAWGGVNIVSFDPQAPNPVENHGQSHNSDPHGIPDGQCNYHGSNGLTTTPLCFTDTDHSLLIVPSVSNAGIQGATCDDAMLKTIRLWIPDTDPFILALDWHQTNCPMNYNVPYTHKWTNSGGVFIFESQIAGQNIYAEGDEDLDQDYCGFAHVCVKVHVEEIAGGTPQPTPTFIATPAAGTAAPTPKQTPHGGWDITPTP